MIDREYLEGAKGSEIRGTTAAGTPFPRAIVAMYAAKRRLKGSDHMPWWLGVDSSYWLGTGTPGYDGFLVKLWMGRYDDDDDDEADVIRTPGYGERERAHWGRGA